MAGINLGHDQVTISFMQKCRHEKLFTELYYAEPVSHK
jgi:hypothetical protein